MITMNIVLLTKLGNIFRKKTIMLYDEKDSLCMLLKDDEFGSVNNQCLAFILQTIYLNYEFHAYWQKEHHSEEKWRKRSLKVA